MYEKNGKAYLDENEYRREGYIMESETGTRRKNRSAVCIAVMLLLLMILLPTLMWLREFRKAHQHQSEDPQTVTGVMTCTSN